MKKKTSLMGICTAIAIMAMGSTAAADPTKKDEKGYEYRFSDDPMQAEPIGAHTAQIHVIQRGRRELLLRPRVQFVTELLKSVESM